MRETARDLAPGRLALRLQELGDFVEHEHQTTGDAGVAGQRRAGADQLAATDFALQRHLLAPFAFAGVEMPLHGDVQLPEQRVAGGKFRERLADRLVEIDAEDIAGRVVGHAHAQVRFQRDHAAGQARENHRERSALALHGGLAALGLFTRARELLGHVIE